jgi:DNA-directed RNA polymerase subunit alpha
MNDILEPNIECAELSEDGSYGKYVVSPLERGYGITLGNALRRVLLSSLTGAAVTAIKIDNIYHEFSTVPGIIEDMTEIILNIKGIRVKLHTDSPKTVCISVTEGRTGELTAGDIVHDDEVEIMNPDHVIAHLNGESKVYMELTIGAGRGYNTAEQNKIEGQPIGVIAIDSIFTPIKKANYIIENTRVGERTDYDSLTLEVWTDGTIAVDEALSAASDILIKHLGIFKGLKENPNFIKVMVTIIAIQALIVNCALIPLAALCTFDGAQYTRRQIIVDLLYHSTDCIADLSDVKFSHFSNSPV